MNTIANAIKPSKYHELHLIAHLSVKTYKEDHFLLFVLFMRLFVLYLKFN